MIYKNICQHFENVHRDLVLSHLIKIQDEEFLKKYTASQLSSSPVNIITPTPGMLMFVVVLVPPSVTRRSHQRDILHLGRKEQSLTMLTIVFNCSSSLQPRVIAPHSSTTIIVRHQKRANLKEHHLRNLFYIIIP